MSAPLARRALVALDPADWTPAQLAPIFKWAGGKRWLIPSVGAGVHRRLLATGGFYLEPFLGGAALAFWLGAPGAILGDVEAPLIAAYTAIAAEPDAVAREIARLVRRGIDQSSYLAVRAARPRTAARRAARLLYLNRLAFNGLYRTNSAGNFNVPWGGYVKPSLPTADELGSAARVLARGELVANDFALIVDRARAGDVVFADPPYDGTGFRSYHRGGFDQDDQARLATALRAAAARGATVLATNADTPFIRAAYAWAERIPTAERRNINSVGAGRGHVPCALFTSDPSILRTSMRPEAQVSGRRSPVNGLR